MTGGGASTARRGRRDEDVLFAGLYTRHFDAVLDYCRRRVATDLVDDVVADTFLTAWRRLDDVPSGDAARLWLYRVAYRVIGHAWAPAQRAAAVSVNACALRPIPRWRRPTNR